MHRSIGTHWIALYVNGNNRICFGSFRVENIPKNIKKFLGNKNATNIYRKQACNSIMYGYFCIGFIDFMLKGIYLFSPNEYENNDKIILKYF